MNEVGVDEKKDTANEEVEEDYSLKFSDKYHKQTRENQKVIE